MTTPLSVKSWHTTPTSGCGFERGADVISADGNRIGQVQHVLADGSSDASEIAMIFEDRILLTLSGQEVHALPVLRQHSTR